MHNIWVLGVDPVGTVMTPGEGGLISPSYESIVTSSNYVVLVVYDDGSNLASGILGAQGGEEGNEDEVLVPREARSGPATRGGGWCEGVGAGR